MGQLRATADVRRRQRQAAVDRASLAALAGAAHLALGDAARRSADAPAAKRSLRNACVLLRKHAPDDVVPASDGETAARLLQMGESSLRLMEAS